MEILISANEQILSLVQNSNSDITEEMNEKQLVHWLESMERGNMNDE